MHTILNGVANYDIYENITLVENFMFSMEKIKNIHIKYRFLYDVLNLFINDFFDSHFLSRLYANYKVGKKYYFRRTYVWHLDDSKQFLVFIARSYEEFRKYLIAGQFFKVNILLQNYLYWFDYYNWRI